MKVGILTYHESYNYGAFLQAYSLCRRLNEEQDITAEIVNYNMPVSMRGYQMKHWKTYKKILRHNRYQFQKRLSESFVRNLEEKKEILSDKRVYSDSIETFRDMVKDKYDIIIAGSDEIWKLDGERGFPTPYWLPGDLGCLKCSYAASSRSDIKLLSEDKRQILQKLLLDFDLISVRDSLTLDLVKAAAPEKTARINCDPSFLYDLKIDKKLASDFLQRKLAEKKGIKKGQNCKNVVLMCEDQTVTDRVLDQVKGTEVNVISVYKYHKGCFNVPELTPTEWLLAIAGADMVISSFFHGVCFSIMSHTPFYAVGTPKKRSKLEELLLGTNMESRYSTRESFCTGFTINKPDEISSADFEEFVLAERAGFDEYLSELRQLWKERKRH